MENVKETLDYIYLTIVKYYKKSKRNNLILTYDNSYSDRLLLEIVKQHQNQFDQIIVYCLTADMMNICNEIVGDSNKIVVDDEINNWHMINNTGYQLSAKNKTYCCSFLKYNYDECHLYPLYDYTNEEIIEMLNYYNIKTNTLVEEDYGLSETDMKLLKDYLYGNLEENNNKEDIKRIFSFVNEQRALRTVRPPRFDTFKSSLAEE